MINNTISGSLVLKYGPLEQVLSDGQCTANAWVGQLTVQTIDFNILFISITVLLTVRITHLLQDSSLRKITMVCFCAWIPGIITSFTALGLRAYGPVGGNWCWIQKQYPILRWGLSFGWRLLIFFLVIGIYTAIYIKLKQSFGHFGVSAGSSEATRMTFTETAIRTQDDKAPAEQHAMKSSSFTVAYELDNMRDSAGAIAGSQTDNFQRPHIEVEQPRGPAPPNLRRMMLLNGYPLGYLILWTPGVVNRFIEIRGTSPRWLVALLASTQYIGLVHAVTYGYNEQIGRSLRSWAIFRRRAEKIDD
ncbi:hypothetical protein NM208_g10014 [Fusarium decemcellulare]|uniref:Uncharacterized protein n=1 Tax=Fusarium decemcellulare TaxID=57161 RepID=A0ACC1RZY5_9HYPO|nr:hypothetical protein NM208_g10014 [Fusarium decemcellulare]